MYRNKISFFQHLAKNMHHMFEIERKKGPFFSSHRRFCIPFILCASRWGMPIFSGLIFFLLELFFIIYSGHHFNDNGVASAWVTKYKGNMKNKIYVVMSWQNFIYLIFAYIQVASILLCCAFFYDIFWVFLSPLIFHQSVMIAVSSYLFFPGPFIIIFYVWMFLYVIWCHRWTPCNCKEYIKTV